MRWFRKKPPQDESPGVGFRNAWDAVDSRAIVTDCCTEQVPVVIVCWPQGSIVQGSFVRLDGTALEFALGAPLAGPPCPALAVANVSFNFRARARVFLAPVLGMQPTERGALLRVRLPDQIAGAEARLSFRVPVGPESGIESQVRTAGGDSIPARALNLSVSGILIEVPRAAGVELAVGASVTLRLEHEGRPVVVEAVVRRRDGERYGLHFPGSLEREDIGDARAIRELIARLERRWHESGS